MMHMDDRGVLISIRPVWTDKILKGKKTYEVRRTRPRMEPPFTVYIYCTQGKPELWLAGIRSAGDCSASFESHKINGSVCAEFVCDRIDIIDQDSNGYMFRDAQKPGKICKVRYFNDYPELLDETCLTQDQISRYLGIRIGYAWHISDLKVYKYGFGIMDMQRYDTKETLTDPPQNMVYVNDPKKRCISCKHRSDQFCAKRKGYLHYAGVFLGSCAEWEDNQRFGSWYVR